jgi:murein DD-endopeptidase MepM/ murein hydrolase activator NlpD
VRRWTPRPFIVVVVLFVCAFLVYLYAYNAGFRAGRTSTLDAAGLPQRSGVRPVLQNEANRVRPEAGAPAPRQDVPSQDLPRQDVSGQDLSREDLGLPIEGLKASDVLDTFDQARPGGRRHEAADILAPRGTPVHAVTDGVIRRLFFSKAGGITVYEFDPAAVYCYYYAHLDHYAEGLRERQRVRKGEVIGYVGTTGDADPGTPHLHFAIFQLNPDKKWWQGTPINPYPTLQRLLQR